VFAIGSVMGLAGFLYAHFMQYVSPGAFGLNDHPHRVDDRRGRHGRHDGALVGAVVLGCSAVAAQSRRPRACLHGGLLVLIFWSCRGIVPACVVAPGPRPSPWVAAR
jgi:hypothetical protein